MAPTPFQSHGQILTVRPFFSEFQEFHELLYLCRLENDSKNRLEASLRMLFTPQSGEQQNCCEANNFGNIQVLGMSLFALFGSILGTVFRNGPTVRDILFFGFDFSFLAFPTVALPEITLPPDTENRVR